MGTELQEGGRSVRATLARHFASGLTIGLCGASGSGKTSFATYLREACHATIHHEGVREWMRERGVTDYSTIDEVAFCELHLHLLSRYGAMSCNVYDRTPADLLFYARARASLLRIDRLDEACRKLAERIHVYVVFPYHAPFLIADGARIIDPALQVSTAASVIDILTTWGLQKRMLIYDHFIERETMLERVEQCARLT